MNSILDFGRWVLSGTWWTRRPENSLTTWGRLAASWVLATVLVALLFAILAAGGFLGGVSVALLWPFGQAAVIVGLVYAARKPTRTS